MFQISVVMPSFNQGAFIEQSIRSVLEQSFEHADIELIVADGASSDNTVSLLERLAAEFDGQLRWLSEPDTGPADAINKALHLAQGDIIGWLNSDDLYDSHAIQTAVHYFSEHPNVLMLYGEGFHIDAEGNRLGRYPTQALSTDAFSRGCPICQPTVFLRKAVFDVFGYLDQSIPTAFDYEFWLRVFKAFPEQIANLDTVLAYSRLHEDCITQRQRRQVAVDGMMVTARHLGKAQSHWVQTYFNEVCTAYPMDEQISDLQGHMEQLLQDVVTYLDPEDYQTLQQQLYNDARWQLAAYSIGADFYDDGWCPPEAELRIAIDSAIDMPSELVLSVQWGKFPLSGVTIELDATWLSEKKVFRFCPWYAIRCKQNGVTLRIPLPPRNDNNQTMQSVKLVCNRYFIPAQVHHDSQDQRQLAFRVCSANWV